MSEVLTWDPSATNNNSGPPDGWPEDQMPSTVNNCGREMMASLARFVSDAGLRTVNLGFDAAVAANDLTVSLKTAATSPANPSTTDPTAIYFRNLTETTGQRIKVNYTAATTVVLPGGGSLGFSNSQSDQIHIWGVYDGTNKDIGISRTANHDENALHSTTTIGTGSDATDTIYTTTGRTNAAITLIGVISIQYGTAAWTNSPTNKTALINRQLLMATAAEVTARTSTTTALAPANLASFAEMLGLPFINLGFTAAVASNDLTITLKNIAGNNPTTADSVPIFFRSTTLTTGQRSMVNFDATTAVVLPGGGSVNFANSETGFMYIYAVYDGTNKDIGIARKAIFDEGLLHSTTTIGTGSDSDIVLYTTTGRTNASVTLIGRITIQYGTAAWTNAPSNLTVWRPGMKKTGDIIQTVATQTGAAANGTTVIPRDDTIPTASEGVEFITRAITPTSALNTLRISGKLYLACSVSTSLIAFIHRQSGAALAVASELQATAQNQNELKLEYEEAAGGISAITYAIRASGDAAGTYYFNSDSGGREFGGVFNSYLKVEEIQA